MPHLLLAGHFGCGNLGDDAILLGFVQGIGPGFDLTVMSGAPEETYRNYGLRSIPRMEMGAFNDEVEQCDALVFAGGSIFQDATSARSVAYYANLVRRAKKANKKVFLVGQGVGPLSGFFAKRLAAAAFNSADAVVCRDPSSPSLLKSIGVTRGVKTAADLAFLLPDPKPTDDANFAVGNMKTIGIAPRPFGKDPKKTIQMWGDLARLMFQSNMMPVLIEMDSKHDGPLIQEIGKTQGGKVPDIRKLATPMQVQGRMARMDAVIAMRLHAGILAATVGVPPMMVAYDPKVLAFGKMLDIGTPVSVEGLSAQKLFDNFTAFQKDRDRHQRVLERKREEFRQLAMVNVETVIDGLKGRNSTA